MNPTRGQYKRQLEKNYQTFKLLLAGQILQFDDRFQYITLIPKIIANEIIICNSKIKLHPKKMVMVQVERIRITYAN